MMAEETSTSDPMPHKCVPDTGGMYCGRCGKVIRVPTPTDERKDERDV